MVKNTIDIYLGPLIYLNNQSTNTGRIPEELKIAKIIPILGDSYEKQNHSFRFYHFSKVYETLSL